MRKNILNFLTKYNLTRTREVNSLIISVFMNEHGINVKNNNILRENIEYNFPNKSKLELELLKIIKQHDIKFDFEILIQLFEFVISPANRVINGAIYTPKNIRSSIIEQTLKNNPSIFLPSYKIADISCGCGSFLIDVARFLKQQICIPYSQIFKKNIYGIDIEAYAVERARLLLALLAILEGEDENFEFNLFIDNSLSFDWKKHIPDFKGFNIILGNPPYVASKHLSDKTRKLLATMQTCQIGNPDLYIPFFELAIENLLPNGILSFITMNSFFKSLNARNLRRYFQDKSLSFKLIDFGAEQVFQSRNTYTCICIIENYHQNFLQYARVSPSSLNSMIKFDNVFYNKLDSYNGWNLQHQDIIKKIEETGTPLGNIYRTSHGLATLKNDIYIFKPVKNDEQYYYLKDKSGKTYPIEKDLCVDIINSNKLSRQVIISELKEKLIFPYTNQQKPKLISESALKRDYPFAYSYLQAHKKILATRDKSKGKYQNWYAFGRTQGLEQIKHKMFFPKYSDITPHYIIHLDEKMYFYNGQAFLGNSTEELEILKKILETRLFWFYISSTSKPYASNYYSLNGTYIKNFGICKLSEKEKAFILKEMNKAVLDKFFEKKYGINLDSFFI